MTHIFKTALAVLAVTAIVSPAAASNGDEQSVSVSAQTEDFSQGLGTLRSVKLEYKHASEDTTVTFTPLIGERKAGSTQETSAGAGLAVYHSWSDIVSTRSALFVSENEPVFARYDLAQDVTAQIGKHTTATVEGRWARYFGDQDVYFASAGIRRYFKRGSVAYRLSRVDPDGRDAFLAHLVNLTVKDGTGNGQTQLWLSAGESSYSRPVLGDQFSGNDLGAVVQRVQPVGGKLAVTLMGGVKSYGRPGKDVTSATFGIGFTSNFGGSDREPVL
jgi:YaiO family outer membrane protein